MRIRLQAILLTALAAVVLTGLASRASAQSSDLGSAQKLAGTWEGKLGGVRSVVVRIGENGSGQSGAQGQVQGDVDFYVLKKTGDGPPVQAGKMTATMVNPRPRGSALDFEIVRQNDGTVLNFSLVSTGDDTARLIRTGGGEENLEVDMTRVE